ncbi:hypothetical protein [Streptomyces sp. NPDC048172]|uniref:hypothetical protein n=1 Tax=Streptomyces sp. NPDC048172 TaxID=3365505 RepID=UPI0037209CF4
MNGGVAALGRRRRLRAALAGGALLGVGGGSWGEVDFFVFMPSVWWSAAGGCALGVILGAASPRRMLGEPRPPVATTEPVEDLRETRYWRFGMPVFAVVMVMMSLVQVLNGRWFMGALMCYCAAGTFLVPQWRYSRKLRRGEDPGPPIPVRRVRVGRRRFGLGAVVGWGLVLAMVVGVLVGALLA